MAALGFIPAALLRGEKPSAPLKLAGKLICVGDSITAGEGVKAEECYVGRLKARAKSENLDLEVIGQGRSGWSTGSYIQNKEEIVKAMPADAAIVTILLGTNDSHEDGTPKEIGKRAAENLGKLIDLYHEKAPAAQFVVISPTKTFPEILTKRLLDAHYGKKTPVNLKAIRNEFETIAKQRGLKFLDLSEAPSSASNSIDGIHPNAAGHQQIFDAVWKCLSAGTR